MGPIDDAGPVSVDARKTAEPSFKVNVYILYTDYIAQSGILRVEPVGDVLKDASLNSQIMPIGHEYIRRISAGSFDSVYEALSFEIRPIFDYLEVASEKPHDVHGLVSCLIETLEMFILFPEKAKLIGYELANHIRWVMMKIDPMGWAQYVNETGFIRGRPGVDQAIPRVEYWNNAQRPPIFFPVGPGRVWAPMRQISGLITPIGRRRNRDRARTTGLPIYDEFVYIPWDDPGDEEYGENQVFHRLRTMLPFIQTHIVPLLKEQYQRSTNIVSAVCGLILTITDRCPRVGKTSLRQRRLIRRRKKTLF